MTVTDADRQAAAGWAKLQGRPHQAANMRRGACDTAPLIQAFARHREAAEAPLRAEVERLREALEEIMGLPGEINPSNYDHDDVCELNRQFCYGYAIARAALGASYDA